MNSALVNVDGREVFVTLSGELIVITLRLLDTNSHDLVVVACEERVCLDLHSYLVALRCQRSLGIICLLLFGEALDRIRFSIEGGAEGFGGQHVLEVGRAHFLLGPILPLVICGMLEASK